MKLPAYKKMPPWKRKLWDWVETIGLIALVAAMITFAAVFREGVMWLFRHL